MVPRQERSHPDQDLINPRVETLPSHQRGCRAGEGLPSSRRHPRYVPRPIRRGVPHGCASRLFAASMAFAPISRGSALPFPPGNRAAE